MKVPLATMKAVWKRILGPVLLSIGMAVAVFSQEDKKLTIESQSDRLMQYAGYWVSSLSPDTDEIGDTPAITMQCIPQMIERSLLVEVLQFREGAYHPILTEVIGYDIKSDSIFAAGHNTSGEFFTGKGSFESESRWTMQDHDLMGNPTMRVEFNFQNETDVIVEGFSNEDGSSLWKTRYIKQNPKDKNVGIQLVSIHQEMLKDPEQTLKHLSRMGYSYVETFVYREGQFYGMSPMAFRSLVEEFGMSFKGSMTFYHLPAAEEWDEAMAWWKQCIADHVEAGVEYLSTSNNQINEIKTLEELDRYCDYYDAVGELCRESGIRFVYHNHADEFLFVEDVRVFDYFMDHTDPELVSFQADVYWMDVGGVDPVAYFEKYANRFVSWHVKDYQELGRSGKIDFHRIFEFQHLPSMKYFVAEVEDYHFPPLYSVNRAWNYLYDELLD